MWAAGAGLEADRGRGRRTSHPARLEGASPLPRSRHSAGKGQTSCIVQVLAARFPGVCDSHLRNVCLHEHAAGSGSTASILRVVHQVQNFTAGLDLFKRIAEVAEAEGHHPDLHLEGWNNVSAVLNTHSVGE